MKKYSILLLIALSIGGCNDFLNRPQLTQQNDATYWTSENNVRLFANGFYTNYFNGYGIGFTWDYAPLEGYNFCDDFASTGKQPSFEAQAPPSRSSIIEGASWLQQYAGPTWDFAWVRKAN